MPSVGEWPTKEGLRIGYMNINHLLNKRDEFSSIIFNSGKQFHLFCCAESWLTKDIPDSDISIPGYNLDRLDRNAKVNPLQTGLILYSSISLTYKRITAFENCGVESMWIEISIKRSKPVLAGFLYRNPSEHVDWFEKFQDMMEAVSLTGNEVILFGDFNIDFLRNDHKWQQIYENYGLTQLVDSPTRSTSKSEKLIDHIYVSQIENIVETCTPYCGCSDHLPICVTWLKKDVKIPKPGHKTVTYRSFTNFDKDAFLKDLSESQLPHVYQYTNPDQAFEFWHKTFINVYNKHAPFITKRVKYSPKPPWLTKEIEEAIHIRNKHLRNKQFDEFKKQRNKVTFMLRKSKKNYFKTLIISSPQNNSKPIWKAIKILTHKNAEKTTVIPKELTTDMLNNFFCNIASQAVKNDKSKTNDLSRLTTFCNSKSIKSEFTIPPIPLTDVYFHLMHMKQTGTRGIDNLDGIILKLSAPVIADTLTYLYNMCLDKCYFPKILKQAKVIPLFKSGNKLDPSNYRPISIVSLLSKPLEKHINEYMTRHVSKYDLIHPSQSGFRSNHSCHTALINLVDEWLTNINDLKLTGILFIDFTKAFDIIDHTLLLRKLTLYKFSDHALSLIKSFLTDRYQSVFINNKQSNFLPLHFGVPQGSVLGPLLFVLYVNDLPLHIKDPCELFADDTSIHSNHSDINQLSINLQENVDQLVHWTELNHMCLNEKKTKCMVVTSRQKRQNLKDPMSPIYIGDRPIEEVDSHKLLGINIDNNLTWQSHITTLSKRISQKIFQLSKIKNFLDRNARKHFYHAFIQTCIDYSSTIFDTSSANTMKPLLRGHKRALKLVLHKSSTLTYKDYTELNILPLMYQLEYNKAVMMFRIMNGLAPSALTAKFPINKSRYTNNILVKKPRIDLYKTSMNYSGGMLWNSIPQTMKQTNSIQSFKASYRKLLFHRLATDNSKEKI